MSSLFGRLLKQGGLYAIGNALLKLSGLILAPLYLNPALLSEAAFGHFVLLEAAWQVMVMFGGLGLGHGMLKYMTDARFADRREAIPFTALVYTVAAAMVLTAVALLFAGPLASAILDDAGQTYIIQLFAGLIFFKIVAVIPFSLLRVRERAGLYSVAIVAEMVIIIGGVFLLMAHLGRGLAGLIEAYALGACISSLLLTGGMLSACRWRLDSRLLKPLAAFGIPIALASVAAILLNVGDRYLLKWLTDAEVVAVYGWAGKLSTVLNMIFVHSFQLAFVVIGLKALAGTEDGASFYRETFRQYVLWTGWAVTGLAVLALDVTLLLSRSDLYLLAEPLVLPVALGFMAYGLYYIVINALYAAGKSRQVAATVFSATVFNIVLNLALIPVLGAMGAAIATLLSYAFLLGFAAILAHRQFAVDYPWKLPVLIALFVTGIYVVSRISIGWADLPRLGFKLGLIASYPMILLAARIYTGAELRRYWVTLRSRIGT